MPAPIGEYGQAKNPGTAQGQPLLYGTKTTIYELSTGRLTHDILDTETNTERNVKSRRPVRGNGLVIMGNNALGYRMLKEENKHDKRNLGEIGLLFEPNQ